MPTLQLNKPDELSDYKSIIVVSTIILLNLLIAMFRFDHWPFSNFTMFSKSVNSSFFYQAARLNTDGSYRLIPVENSRQWNRIKYNVPVKAKDESMIYLLLSQDCAIFYGEMCKSMKLGLVKKTLKNFTSNSIIIEQELIFTTPKSFDSSRKQPNDI